MKRGRPIYDDPQRIEDIVVLHVAGWTFHEIGNLLGITRERVRQIFNKHMRRGSMFHWWSHQSKILKRKPYVIQNKQRKAMQFFNDRGQQADLWKGKHTILLNEQHVVYVHAVSTLNKVLPKASPWYPTATLYWRTHMQGIRRLHVVVLPDGGVIPIFERAYKRKILYIRHDVPHFPPPDALTAGERRNNEEMKRTQSSMLICQGCRHGITQHHGPGEGFFEIVPGPDGTSKKMWWHVKRCWPNERNRRKKEKRARERAVLEVARTHKMEDTEQPVLPPPLPAKSGFQGRRGIGLKAYEILDSIELDKEWTVQDLEEKLKVHGFVTTKATVGQFVWTYRHERRDAEVVRRLQKGKGSLKVYAFRDPPPKEPPTTTSSHNKRSAPRLVPKVQPKEQPSARVVEAVGKKELANHPEILEEVKPPTRPLPKPAPSPGLSNSDVNRAFNDFQAFILEALQDFRNEILKKLR